MTGTAVLGRPRIGLGTVVVLALAAALVAWVLIDRQGLAEAPSTGTPAPADGPRVPTVDGLSALAALRDGPIYWAGPRRGFALEVTENAVGQVFIRYLPSATELGDPRADFLTVATYPRRDAFADVEAAAKRPGAVVIPLPGALAVYDEAAPTSVYLAYRGSTEQIEVYAPSADEARRLVESGRVGPVP